MKKINGILLTSMILFLTLSHSSYGNELENLSAQSQNISSESPQENQLEQNSSPIKKLIIDDIVCEGNENTDCDFILKKYYQKPGDVLEPEQIDDARLRLGTMHLFKNIRIHLTKGKQRGHVIVVVNVQEAENIQYTLNSGLSQSVHTRQSCIIGSESATCSKMKSKNNHLSFSTGLNNYNFLGTGKIFGSNLSYQKSDSTIQSNLNFQDSDNRVITGDDATSEVFALNNQYIDEHLFDSSHYYLHTNLSWSHAERKATSIRFIDDNQTTIRNISSADYAYFSALIGRRFGRHSYISLSSAGSIYSNDENYRKSHSSAIALSYGWNNEDDLLFPSHGEAFSTSIIDQKFSSTLQLDFRKHFALSNNQVLTGYARYGVDNPKVSGLSSTSSATMSAELTTIIENDKSTGHFSGWDITLSFSDNDSPYTNQSIAKSLSVSYKKQTPLVLYQFTLGYLD